MAGSQLECQAIGEIMNVSIEWPKGRGDSYQPEEQSMDSFIADIQIQDQHVDSYSCELDPFVLALDRKRDWPNVSNYASHIPVFQIYQRVRDSGLPNMLSVRAPVPSQLKTSVWESLRTGHPDNQYVIEGVRYKFPLHYVGPPLARPNRDSHASADQYTSHVLDYVRTETDNFAMLGPFEESPFDSWLNISQLMTRPKSGSTKRRIIVDLSFPSGDNVNAFVCKNMLFGRHHDHRLPTIADTLKVIEDMGYNALVGTIDVERAYQNIPVCPLDLPLLGIRVGANIYVDTAMPFGARNSSLNMQMIAQFIVRALQLRNINCQMYLDDMVVQLSPSEDYHARFREILTLYRALGLPISYSKLQPPAESVVYLGIAIDIPTRTMTIPDRKLRELEQLIRWAITHRHITKKITQRIAGKINHVSKCVPPARLFMARVLAALRAADQKNEVDVAIMKPDLHWFIQFLRRYNGRSIMKPSLPSKIIRADSCLTGGGGTDMVRAYELVYTPRFAEAHHISTLEAVNCLVALRTLLNSTDRDTTIELRCDSESAIAALAFGRARDSVLLAVCRAAWYLSASMNINVLYTHVPGYLMDMPDALSRAHLGPQHRTRADLVIAKNNLTMVKPAKWATNYSNYM